MRALFFIALVIVILLGVSNGYYLPHSQKRAKKILDDYVLDLPIENIEERQYDGRITLRPKATYIENLRVKAESGTWLSTKYTNITMEIPRINFKADPLLWKGESEIESIGEIKFEANIGFDEIEKLIARHNQNISDLRFWYDGGHFFMRLRMEILKGHFEFDGNLILSPAGELKYQIRSVINEEGEEVYSKQLRIMIDENLNLVLPVRIMGHIIVIDNLEIHDDFIRIKGKSKSDELEAVS